MGQSKILGGEVFKDFKAALNAVRGRQGLEPVDSVVDAVRNVARKDRRKERRKKEEADGGLG